MRYIKTAIISSVLIVTLAVTMLACASVPMDNIGNSNDGTSNKEVSQDEESAKTIKMITWDNDGTVNALNAINEMFYEETGIKVELEYVPSQEYEDFLKKEIESNEADIFCYTSDSKAFAQPRVDWAPMEMLTWESIIADGYAQNLSGYEFVNNWSTGSQACKYKKGIYGIATGMTIMNGLFYDKKLFDEHGWQEPLTWDEFVGLCEDIRKTGIEPITVGGADIWPVQMITNAIVDSVVEGAAEELSEGLWKGSHKYTDDVSMEIYRREKQILSYMEPDYLNVSYAECPARFTEGSAAMFYGGSWNAAEIEAANPEFEYDYFAIPGNNRHNFTGKYDLTIGINAKSDRLTEAVKWLEYFSKPEVYTVYIDTNGFVPTMSWISTSNNFLIKIDDRLKDFDRTYECYNRVPNVDLNYGTYDLINYTDAGGIFDTPEEFANAAQKDWDEALEALTDK